MLKQLSTFVRNLVIYEPQVAGLFAAVALLFLTMIAQHFFETQHAWWSVLQTVAVVGIALLFLWLFVKSDRKIKR